MIGSNTLMLNHATIMAAVQFYLNECVFMSDACVEIKSVQAGDCSTLATFKVVLAEPAVEVKK